MNSVATDAVKTVPNEAAAIIQSARETARRDRAAARGALNDLFRSGRLPKPAPAGRYKGDLIITEVAPGLTQLSDAIAARWMPWQGKTFDPVRPVGDNIFTKDSLRLARILWPLYRGYVDDGPDTYRAFAFRTRSGPGLADPDHQVLKIDYDLPSNPAATVRRVLDELVEVGDGLFLGKAHLHWWWGSWQTVAYFTLQPAH